MLENRNEIEIDAPVEKVWNILTDLEKYADWNPLLYKVSGKLSVGETVIAYAKTATKDMKFVCRVTRVEPDREFAWTFPVIHPFLFQGEHIFRVEALGAARVRFIDRELFEGLLLPTQTKDLASSGHAAMVEMGKALKERAEKS